MLTSVLNFVLGLFGKKRQVPATVVTVAEDVAAALEAPLDSLLTKAGVSPDHVDAAVKDILQLVTDALSAKR